MKSIDNFMVFQTHPRLLHHRDPKCLHIGQKHLPLLPLPSRLLLMLAVVSYNDTANDLPEIIDN